MSAIALLSLFSFSVNVKAAFNSRQLQARLSNCDKTQLQLQVVADNKIINRCQDKHLHASNQQIQINTSIHQNPSMLNSSSTTPSHPRGYKTIRSSLKLASYTNSTAASSLVEHNFPPFCSLSAFSTHHICLTYRRPRARKHTQSVSLHWEPVKWA